MPAADSCMPVRHVEDVEELEDRFARLGRALVAAVEDDRIDAAERDTLDRLLSQAGISLRSVKLGAHDIVAGAELIRTVATTFAVTPYVGRRLREQEAARLKRRRMTPTGTYLEVLYGGGGDGPDHDQAA